MCGRYTLTAVDEQLAQEFDLIIDAPWQQPRYNIAPTQSAPIVRAAEGDKSRHLALHRWGLIPFWAKDPAIGNRMINARSETAVEKPSFRAAMKQRRCLVPCAGFYEWKVVDPKGGKGGKPKKQPHYIRRADERLFAFAGLWERWKPPDADPIDSYTILTTTPNELLESIHDRMPVIIDPADYDLWLDPEIKEVSRINHLLAPYPADELAAYPVGLTVNSPKNDDPACIKPVDSA